MWPPSTLTWPRRGLKLRQRTRFPYGDTTELILDGSGTFDIKVRVPGWATRGFTIAINGQDQVVNAIPGTYLTLKRTWRDGDTVRLTMPFGFHLHRVMDRPNIASLFYGPILLAAEEMGAEDGQVKVDSFDGLLVKTRKGQFEINLPLVELEVSEDSPNYQLIEDYWYWFWNWRAA